MSWDIELICNDNKQVGKLSETQEEGGTYVLGDSTDAELNVTWNYGKHFRFKETLNEKIAKETIPILEKAVLNLGIVQDDNYWNPTEGNVGYACSILLKMAKELPDHVWNI